MGWFSALCRKPSFASIKGPSNSDENFGEFFDANFADDVVDLRRFLEKQITAGKHSINQRQSA
jgi:predicted HD phosphohydrolase